MYYRWFTDPDSRRIYPAEDHPMHSRIFTADLRAAYSRDGKKSRADAIVTALLAASPEFSELWADHEIRHRPRAHQTYPTPRTRRS